MRVTGSEDDSDGEATGVVDQPPQPRAGRPARGGADDVEWSLEAGDTAGASRLRRRIVAALAEVADPGGDLASAELVVGELLANAVHHTAGPARVALRWDGTHPLLSVSDVGEGFAVSDARVLRVSDGTIVPRLPQDPLAEDGRGLYLVARLARDVAVAPRHSGGTIVSVTLDLQRSELPVG